jgi:hypothetical protein
MCAVVVVVTNVLVHQAFQMTLIEDNNMIELISAAIANPALGDAILPQASETGSFGLNAEALYAVDHLFIEIRSPVENQILRRGIIGERFSYFAQPRQRRGDNLNAKTRILGYQWMRAWGRVNRRPPAR